MVFIKFKLVLTLLLVSSTVLAQERFSSKSCLDSNFEMTMSHRGILFGLLSQELTIDKKDCIIKVRHRKYLAKEWVVDICREPVHIKISNPTGVDVAKKTAECDGTELSREAENFCGQYNELMNHLQDDGLIFAEGDRDSLSSDHGKTYCVYLLLKQYLEEGTLFSRYTAVPNIFDGAKIVPSPEKIDVEEKTTEPEVKEENKAPESGANGFI